MKGRSTFTTVEIKILKELIGEKVLASTHEQKRIRGKIRKIGFHYSDFSTRKDGYTVADFEELILSRQIKISNIPYYPTLSGAPLASQEKQTIKRPDVVNKIHDFDLILNGLKGNRFDPKTDSENIIANSAGNYILCLKPNVKFPITSIKPVLKNFDGLQVIYTGIAGNSLRTRDFRQHFKGNAGRSTLRKSLGVLFGYKQIPRDSDPSTGKTKFGATDEIKLSEWMHNNLVMFFLPTEKFNSIEDRLINHFNPPLNLKDNSNAVNSDFRRLLSSLRTEKH